MPDNELSERILASMLRYRVDLAAGGADDAARNRLRDGDGTLRDLLTLLPNRRELAAAANRSSLVCMAAMGAASCAQCPLFPCERQKRVVRTVARLRFDAAEVEKDVETKQYLRSCDSVARLAALREQRAGDWAGR